MEGGDAQQRRPQGPPPARSEFERQLASAEAMWDRARAEDKSVWELQRGQRRQEFMAQQAEQEREWIDKRAVERQQWERHRKLQQALWEGWKLRQLSTRQGQAQGQASQPPPLQRPHVHSGVVHSGRDGGRKADGAGRSRGSSEMEQTRVAGDGLFVAAASAAVLERTHTEGCCERGSADDSLAHIAQPLGRLGYTAGAVPRGGALASWAALPHAPSAAPPPAPLQQQQPGLDIWAHTQPAMDPWDMMPLSLPPLPAAAGQLPAQQAHLANKAWLAAQTEAYEKLQLEAQQRAQQQHQQHHPRQQQQAQQQQQQQQHHHPQQQQQHHHHPQQQPQQVQQQQAQQPICPSGQQQLPPGSWPADVASAAHFAAADDWWLDSFLE